VVAPITIDVLSNRADLVSGGEALVAVALPAGTKPAGVRVDLGKRDISAQFAWRPNGKFEGLVTGLVDGPNVLTAKLPDGAGAAITIASHPIGGPVLSGPQIEPWTCAAGAVDKQCNRPVTYHYSYKSALTGLYLDYDPRHPPLPALVATTVTDQGIRVPNIVRVETGEEDRGKYQVAVLDDPSQPWAPWAPQRAWNGKLEVPGGASCSVTHGDGAPGGGIPGVMDANALSQGWAVATSSLLNNGQNCNLVVQAEALMMLKEHIVNTYGEIRYTVGEGCSGGSIYQQQVANAYPGLLDGLIVACSYPDDWSTMVQPVDCGLLLSYFTNIVGALQRGVGWTEGEKAAVVDDQSILPCLSWVVVASYNKILDPSNNGAPNNCGVAPADVYRAATNPRGIRCDLQDYMVNEFGRRPDGFANRPFDNVGVQYGLKAVKEGTITPHQFVDLNANLGGYDINLSWQPGRSVADPGALSAVYRSGAVNEGNGLSTVPIIDLRGHDSLEIHEDFRTYTLRDRLDAANGGHGNQIVWTGLLPLVGDLTFLGGTIHLPVPLLGNPAFQLMDRWLANVEADRRAVPLDQKVNSDKPPGAADACFDGIGNRIPSRALCQALFPYQGDPRIGAGAPPSDDVLKCQLKPLNRDDYGPHVTFTNAEWSVLQRTYPGGVCNYAVPGVDQGPATPWLSYNRGPGGQPLGVRPVSTPSER
jgi:hypothetical protein